MKKEILNIIAFCLLMENNDGILGKSSDYVLEKFRRYIKDNDEFAWMNGLDQTNYQKLKEYAKKWLNKDIEKEAEELYTKQLETKKIAEVD